ncbi:MAG: hypothetical protein M1839_005247 [Geoglossum umbratile]|nr:MAG: hypothetical protein M1839_005247 [Geoglossum umbratile]
MGLVDYSDSEHSDSDTATAPAPKPTTAPPTSSKPIFKKVVDRSNPGKILVNLPRTAEQSEESAADGPPAKRARVGGGGGAFSGFNALLPAPKRTGQAMGGGLGRGVSLKTGATPGFSREEAADSLEDIEDGQNNSALPPPLKPALETPQTDPKPAPKPVGPSTMFKPLSVSRKLKKKNPPTNSATSTPQPSNSLPPPKPKPSLFSLSPSSSEPLQPASSSNEDYTPLLYNPTTDPPDNTYPSEPPHTHNPSPPPQPQTLDLLADTLNLTPSQKRQLLGRRPPTSSAPITLLTFNTDTEYASNNALRAAGETVQHNPVRAIAPGKHSLKQLVNAASNQKEALEEHFATGKRNKKEAGSRYGW